MTGLDKLQEIGAHKIYERTHIAKKFVEDILNQKYTSMNKIQFAGFLSILEREYSVDLHELSAAYATELKLDTEEEYELFAENQHEGGDQGKSKGLYVFIGLAAVALVIYILNPSSQEELSTVKPVLVEVTPVKNELNNTTIEEARLNLSNLGNETQKLKTTELVAETSVEPAHRSKFEIIPRSNLWIGIVDLETFARTQKLGSTPFELDKDKEWLLVMGHGFVNFEVNGKEQTFKDENKVWFSYENGILNKISRSEFKEKNRGKAW